MGRQFGLSLFLLFLSQNLSADVKLPALFSDNMVLQQREKVALWGWAEPGETVDITASWNGKTVETQADAEGNWQASLKTPKAGGPYTLTFQGNNRIELENVLLGEVWLCSGQSNMHFPVAPIENSNWATGVIHYAEEIAASDYPKIRMFTVARKVADKPQKDVEGNWVVSSPATVGDFSAVAFFFARTLTEATGLPIGLINASWGGTPAEGWTPKEVLAEDFQSILERYQQALKAYPRAYVQYKEKLAEWKKATEKAGASGEKPKRAPREPIGPNHHKSPYKLYNAMIAPLVPYTIKGAIWYQGESNADRPYQYRKLFPAMIKSWRGDWDRQFPFYFVQIAPHRSQGPLIREAQLFTLLALPHTGMAVTTDWGDALDIHPRNKQVVGRRLALWALAKDYGQKDIVYSGPIYKSMKVEDNKIRLRFEYSKEGLEAKGGALTGFTIAGTDQKFMPAKATIEGDEVVVWHEAIKNPVAVRFAWKKVPAPNFYNKAGLPASPFRTDEWDDETLENTN